MDFAPPVISIAPHESTKPLTVVLICTQRRWLGGEEQAALLAQGLVRQGHRCKILARRSSGFAANMSVRGFDVRCFSRHGRSPRGIWQIRRWLQRWQPDILHFNDPHALTSAGIASLGLSIPLRIVSRRVDFPLKNVARYRRNCDALICVSRAVRRVCLDAGLSEQSLYIVPDGVDPQRMVQGDSRRGRDLLNANGDTTTLLTVAKLTDHKGHRFMMDAMPRIVREHPNVVWAIAGDGPLWKPLQAQCHRLGIDAHVKFLGFRRDVPDLMAAADIMVVPSHMEGLCSSIADAMLARVPVVATRAGGIPDLLDRADRMEPAAGWLVPPRDPEALAKGVLDALRFPAVTAQRRDEARRRAEREFTADRMVAQTLAVYRDAMTANGRLSRVG